MNGLDDQLRALLAEVQEAALERAIPRIVDAVAARLSADHAGDLLTIEEAAKVRSAATGKHVTPASLRAKISRGTLMPVRHEGRVLLRRADVEGR